MHNAMQRTGQAPEAGIKVSFELFPPKTEQGLRNLDDTVDRLAALHPEYFSVTYGAGGTTRDRTRGVVTRVASAHRAAGGASPDLRGRQPGRDRGAGARAVGIGRAQAGGAARRPARRGRFEPRCADGYSCAADLVAALMPSANFDIRVACHPEVHPDAVSPQADLDNLKRKFDAGATGRSPSTASTPTGCCASSTGSGRRGIDGADHPGDHAGATSKSEAVFGGLRRHRARLAHRMFDGLDDDPGGAYPDPRRGDGHDDPGRKAGRGRLSRHALRRSRAGRGRQQRAAVPDAARHDPRDPRRVPGCGRRHRLHQHLLATRSARPTTGWSTSCRN
jgi:methylenetetrahydrofolate reductase (NADPH)